MIVHANLFYSHTGYEVISYFRLSKFETAESVTYDSFWSNFSCAVLPAPLIGGLLVASWHDLRPPSFVVHPSITKWVARKSRERFDVKSPNLTMTSIPTYSTTTLDMTSLITSRSKLFWQKLSKMLPLMALSGISQEWFKGGSWNFTHSYWGQSASQTCQIWRH